MATYGCGQVILLLVIISCVIGYERKTSVSTDSSSTSTGQDIRSSNMEARIQELETGIEDLQRQLDQVKQTAATKRDHNPVLPTFLMADAPMPEIGFHVKLEITQKLAKNETIKFDQAITRIGNAYDTNTGVFTCVQPGTYMFSMNIVSDQYNLIEAAIKKNNISILNAVSDNHGGSAWNQGGGMAIVRLKTGDTVFVKIVWLGNGMEGKVYGSGLSSFSGYLLRATN